MKKILSQNAFTGLLMVLAIFVANAVLTSLNLQRLQTNDDLVSHTYEVLLKLKSVLLTTVDAETSQRGYLISGEEQHLEPLHKVEISLSAIMERLRILTLDNPTQQTHWGDLNQKLDIRMRLIRNNVALRKQEDFETSQSTQLIAEGKKAMDAIRAIIAEMEREEFRLLAIRTGESRVSLLTTMITGLISTILGISVTLVGYRMALRDIERHDHIAKILKESNEALEIRVRERTEEISNTNAELKSEIEHRQRAQERATKYAEELHRSNRELEQFASVASHDLQEPLRKIQAFGDRLRIHCAGQLGEKGNDYLDRILFSTTRIRKLIDDLLAYARVGDKSHPFTKVDLAVIARDVIGDLEVRLQQTGGRVEIQGLPTIEADPLLMRQLLQNLLGNALKFHRPDAAPVVQVSTRELPSFNGDNRNALCEITVSDNGIGFEQVYADRLFEPFQRLHSGVSYEGTGMGLAICKKIVEKHHGRITATSTPGQCTRFIVTLPIHHNQLGANA